MKKIKKSSCFVGLGLICILLIFGFHMKSESKSVSVNDENIPISRIQGSFVIDVHDQRELVASADYVFVGEVLKFEGYEYRDSTSPYTNYTVQVLENIKGNLIMDQGIPIVKEGGLSKDGNYYELFEDGELPVEKGIYIFYAFAQQDGSLLAAGPNSNIKIDVPADGNDSGEDAGQNQEYIVETSEGTNQNETLVVDEAGEDSEGTGQNEESVVDEAKEALEGTNQNEEIVSGNETEAFFRNTDIYKEVVDASNHQEDVDIIEMERYTSIYEAADQ